ncbi:uncharacterized protein LOC118753173 [Rhagoletis pomonella]|uniref:uncharacterized protein LOC118753173 n=1 Tax=Rhagoletis pomonella TaxID=28610 RepID=UPI00177AC8CA|nr:uncharacterized protein LOC118753173 [Rhagoletis pomonella]
MVALIISIITVFFLSQVLAQDQNVLEVNGREGANNTTLMDVHIRLFNELLRQESLSKKNVVDSWYSSTNSNRDASNELENILWDTVDSCEWPLALYLIGQFTNNTQNSTVHYIAFKVLWRKLKANKMLYDPRNVIDLYLAMRNITLEEHGIHNLGQFQLLKKEVRGYLIERSAQLLEVPLHPANYNDTNIICANDTSYPLVRQVISQLNQLDEDIFEEVLNVTFDAAQLLESDRSVANALNCLGLNSNQRLIAHLTFLNRNSDFQLLLYSDVQQLLSECDMGKLLPKYLKQISDFMPESMVALHKASAICIHNTTGSFGYLSECAQTALMCTYSSGYKYRSVFQIERLLGNRYTFYSTFWMRYIKLETNYSNINSSMPPAFIKNVYSSESPSVWQAVFVGNSVALMDASMRQYLCGGNQTMWSKSEQYVYTRRVEDFQLYKNECLWLIEDCSYMI